MNGNESMQAIDWSGTQRPPIKENYLRKWFNPLGVIIGKVSSSMFHQFATLPENEITQALAAVVHLIGILCVHFCKTQWIMEQLI